MPAPAPTEDSLPARQRRILADIRVRSERLDALDAERAAVVADRHRLFARGAAAGIAISTLAAAAGVSGPAVTKAVREQRGG